MEQDGNGFTEENDFTEIVYYQFNILINNILQGHIEPQFNDLCRLFLLI